MLDFQLTGGLFLGGLPQENVEPASLAYLPPECTRNPGAELRPYTDIYGIGMILYELLTGRPPFAAENARGVLEQIQAQEPVPPSRRNLKVPSPFDTICLRCLHKNPWRRYHRAHDLLAALQYVRKELGDKDTASKRRSRRATQS